MLTLCTLLQLLSLQAPLSPQAPATGAPEKRESCFEVLQTWTGNELDHLGIGVCTLGDVDADGVPDFILGTMTGAYTFNFGPGSARVISGKTGKMLYEVHGTNKEGDCGDAYGDTISAIGDIDKDGVCDFAVGAWRYEEYRGYVAVYSGKTGKPLATIYGGPNVQMGKEPVPPEHCGAFDGAALGGSIVALGDVDGDSIPDFAIGGQMQADPSYLISGATLSIVGSLPGMPIAVTGDYNGDGRPDILCWGRKPYEFTIVSGVSLTTLATISVDTKFTTCVPIGDLDGDGYADVLVTPNGNSADSSEGTRLPIHLISGRTGKTLQSMTLAAPGERAEFHYGTLGDVDRDGVPDFFVHAQAIHAQSVLWIISGKSGEVLVRESHESCTWGRRIVPAGSSVSVNHDRFLVTEYESQQGARCGGAVHLARIKLGK
jgi:hypothetical protein